MSLKLNYYNFIKALDKFKKNFKIFLFEQRPGARYAMRSIKNYIFDLDHIHNLLYYYDDDFRKYRAIDFITHISDPIYNIDTDVRIIIRHADSIFYSTNSEYFDLDITEFFSRVLDKDIESSYAFSIFSGIYHGTNTVYDSSLKIHIPNNILELIILGDVCERCSQLFYKMIDDAREKKNKR